MAFSQATTVTKDWCPGCVEGRVSDALHLCRGYVNGVYSSDLAAKLAAPADPHQKKSTTGLGAALRSAIAGEQERLPRTYAAAGRRAPLIDLVDAESDSDSDARPALVAVKEEPVRGTPSPVKAKRSPPPAPSKGAPLSRLFGDLAKDAKRKLAFSPGTSPRARALKRQRRRPVHLTIRDPSSVIVARAGRTPRGTQRMSATIRITFFDARNVPIRTRTGRTVHWFRDDDDDDADSDGDASSSESSSTF